jgi:hypothetical protein
VRVLLLYEGMTSSGVVERIIASIIYGMKCGWGREIENTKNGIWDSGFLHPICWWNTNELKNGAGEV